MIIIIATPQHKSRATCPNSEFVFRFYIYYRELSHIANSELNRSLVPSFYKNFFNYIVKVDDARFQQM